MARKLPPWKSLKTHFPASNAATVARLIGGKVQYNYDIKVFTNFCCIRVSRALNLSGHPVRYFKDTGANGKLRPAVSSGKNKQWHIFRVRSLRKYMESNYGKGEPHNAATYKQKLKGRHGIILQEVPGMSDASGHADCWDNDRCLWDDFGSRATAIFFWPAS